LASETRMREIVVLAPNQNNREPVAVVLRDKSEQHVTSANAIALLLSFGASFRDDFYQTCSFQVNVMIECTYARMGS